MKHEINTEIKIKASKQEIWNILMDFENYSEWNPFIEKIEGDPKLGNKIFVKLGGMSFRPKVKSNVEQQEFSWLGRLLMPGIFDGNHIFILKEDTNGTVNFIHKERFFGILVPFMKKKLNTEVKSQFEAMNEALKLKVEAEKTQS